MKHTPGPWTVFTGKDGTRFVVEGEGTGRAICEIVNWTHEAWGESNAELIAAAPELLKCVLAAWHTLQSLLAVREGIPDDQLKKLADHLQRVMAKAAGRS